MSQKPTISEPRLDPSKTPKCANISASRTKFKIRLDGSQFSPLGNYHAEFGVSSMFRLGCRGGVESAAAHLVFFTLFRFFLSGSLSVLFCFSKSLLLSFFRYYIRR